MKRLQAHMHTVNSHNFCRGATYEKIYTQPLTHADIIEIQDKFLTNGFHYLPVSSLETGRSIMKSFLDLLPCYYEKAVLTVDALPHRDGLFNIYQTMVDGGFLEASTGLFFAPDGLEQFFIEQLYVDLMWIEQSEELSMTSWFTPFKKVLVDFKIDQHIPILILVCE